MSSTNRVPRAQCRDAARHVSLAGITESPRPIGKRRGAKDKHAPPCRDAFLRLSKPPGLRNCQFYSAISRAETQECVSITFRRTHGYTPHIPNDGRRGAPRLYGLFPPLALRGFSVSPPPRRPTPGWRRGSPRSAACRPANPARDRLSAAPPRCPLSRCRRTWRRARASCPSGRGSR